MEKPSGSPPLDNQRTTGRRGRLELYAPPSAVDKLSKHERSEMELE